MSLPGPAPTPTSIQKFLGNPGKNRLNDAEPLPEVAKATPPRSLTDKDARKMYKLVAAQLVRFNMLTKIDTHELAMACDQWAAACRLWESYKCEPFTKGGTGLLTINPAYRAALQGFEAARKTFHGFGIGSPAERSRLRVAEAPKKSKFSGLITPTGN
jgi:P27 family predicted phage terminase small subunit